jgi:probable F420-dependent oxidoreductase
VKIRIGFGPPLRTALDDPGELGALVDSLEGNGFDSLWLSERLTGPGPDPLIAIAIAAGRSRRLRFGTGVLVLPGRNPVVLAKEIASLDRLSGGRFHPAVGLGAVEPREQAAFGVARSERAAWVDEALPLMRQLWSGEPVHHGGSRFPLDGVRLKVTPHQDPLEVWLGGRVPVELRRIGRLGDGWLPSFMTPDEVAEGWAVINDVAAEHGRSVPADHLGMLVPYADGPLSDDVAALFAARRPEVDARDLVAGGLDDLRAKLEAYIAIGASKFVVLPLAAPADWDAELSRLAEAVLPLQQS